MTDGAKKRTTLRAALVMAACLSGMTITTAAEAAPVRKVAPEPAATLLLPYFEVDLGDANGPTTLFSINNASADRGAGPRRGLVGPVGPGPRLQRLPDRL